MAELVWFREPFEISANLEATSKRVERARELLVDMVFEALRNPNIIVPGHTEKNEEGEISWI